MLTGIALSRCWCVMSLFVHIHASAFVISMQAYLPKTTKYSTHSESHSRHWNGWEGSQMVQGDRKWDTGRGRERERVNCNEKRLFSWECLVCPCIWLWHIRKECRRQFFIDQRSFSCWCFLGFSARSLPPVFSSPPSPITWVSLSISYWCWLPLVCYVKRFSRNAQLVHK